MCLDNERKPKYRPKNDQVYVGYVVALQDPNDPDTFTPMHWGGQYKFNEWAVAENVGYVDTKWGLRKETGGFHIFHQKSGAERYLRLHFRNRPNAVIVRVHARGFLSVGRFERRDASLWLTRKIVEIVYPDPMVRRPELEPPF